jgi:hypothetical protein
LSAYVHLELDPLEAESEGGLQRRREQPPTQAPTPVAGDHAHAERSAVGEAGVAVGDRVAVQVEGDHAVPPRSSRVAMVTPILPSPTIAMSIGSGAS